MRPRASVSHGEGVSRSGNGRTGQRAAGSVGPHGAARSALRIHRSSVSRERRARRVHPELSACLLLWHTEAPIASAILAVAPLGRMPRVLDPCPGRLRLNERAGQIRPRARADEARRAPAPPGRVYTRSRASCWTEARTGSRSGIASYAATRWWSTPGPPGAVPAASSSRSSRDRRSSAASRVAFLGVNSQDNQATRRSSSTTTRCRSRATRTRPRMAATFNVVRPPATAYLRPPGRTGLPTPGWIRERGQAGRGHRALRSLTFWTSGPHAPTQELAAALGPARARVLRRAGRLARGRPRRSRPRGHAYRGAWSTARARAPAGSSSAAAGAARAPRGRARRARAGVAAAILAEATASRRARRRRAHLAARPDLRPGAVPARWLPGARRALRWRRGSSTWRWRSGLPELRIDPLSGLRVIVAGERGTRPGAWLEFPPRPPIDPERDPFAEGTRTRRRPRSTRCGRERARLAGLAGARGAQPLSGARAGRARPRHDPLAGGAASPSCSPPARRAARTS